MRACFPFSPRSKKRNQAAAGVFIDAGCLRYVQTGSDDVRHDEVVRCLDLAMHDAPDRSAAQAYYRGAFSALRAAGAPQDVPVAFALPFTACAIKWTNGQGLSLEEVRSSVDADFSHYFSFPGHEAAYDIAETRMPDGPMGDRRAFLLAAAREEQVRALMDACADCGYALAAVEPAQVALERALGTMRVHKAGAALALFLTGDEMFCSLSLDGQPFFFHLADAVQAEEDVLGAIRFVWSQHPELDVKQIDVWGPGYMKNTTHCIGDAYPDMAVAVHAADDLGEGAFRGGGERWFVPYGLAIRGSRA